MVLAPQGGAIDARARWPPPASGRFCASPPCAVGRQRPELVAAAKAKPGGLTFASPGIEAPSHMAAELLERLAGLDATHVPYKGGGPTRSDLLGGHVQWMLDSVAPLLPHVPAGRLRASRRLRASSTRRARAWLRGPLANTARALDAMRAGRLLDAALPGIRQWDAFPAADDDELNAWFAAPGAALQQRAGRPQRV